MSENFFVSVLKVISFNSDILNAPERIHKDVIAFITYDSQGVKARFTKRDKENGYNDSQHILEDDDNSILLDLLLTKKTNVTKKRDVHIIHTADELAFIKFANNEYDMKFDKILKDLKGSYNNSVFLQRTEESSASQYFQFYGYLSQQQNMMQDFVRTSTYQKAIHGNFSDFNGKIVLDVGAGSGILSFFAVQAGAAKVYAVEASNMAQYAQQLVASNNLSERIEVIAGKIEEIELPQKVDIIISEPMGYMLFNERMLETYLHAKKWLKPNGKMFPSRGDLHVAPFCDEALYMEQFNKANFWYQTSFHNVDLSNLRNAAMKEYFQQPIVDTFDIRICLAKSIRHVVDFLQADEFDLHNIDIPLEFHMLETGTVHGLAFWFDVEFVGSTSQIWLSTSPTEPLTHWYQVRCLLQNPIFVKQGQLLTGRVILIANKRQSYDVTIELNLEGTQISSHNTLDIKNPYFRYTGGPVQVPPGTNTQSPSETYWSQLDTQATRTAVNLINGISINGLGEVNLDMPQTIINPNLIGNQGQQQQQIQYQNINPNIHTGLISSTGRNPTFPASNHHNSSFSNQMDTSNGKPDEKAQVYDIGAGTTQPAAGAHSMDSNGKPGTATTFIDTTMLNAMQAMFSPPMHNASQIQVQQQQQQPQQQQQYSQQFHPHLKHQMFQHPTTAATSTPQLYFN